jgi:2-polyprenyl-3-methyl-5-hydroxy-6-metoxy-1,4-benzoquinol methylase
MFHVKPYSEIQIQTCALCGSKQFSPVVSPVDFRASGALFQVVRCDECAHTFTNPRPKDEDLYLFYGDENYISHTNDRRGLFNKIYLTVKKFAIKRKVALVSALSQKESILDIGCGTGDFLAACKHAGWKVTGIEPSPNARQYAKETHGFEPLPAEAVFELPEDTYNAITLWHVLEHLPDLNRYFSTLSKLLKKDGVLVIAVPNHQSYDAQYYHNDWAAWDVPIHVSHFTKATMKQWAAKFGFSVVEIKNMPFDSYYVSMLSEKNRNNGFSFLAGFWCGLVSNLNAGRNNASSLIYVLKKV